MTGVKFVLQFRDSSHMTFTQVAGPSGIGLPCENEIIHESRIAPGIFFIRWVESTGIAVNHVDSFNADHATVSSIVPASISGLPGPISVSFEGGIRPYHGAPMPAGPNNGSGQ